jgi:hypothetical protein
MVDLRLYRIAFIPAIAAVVALLFSLESRPDPLRSLIAPGTFKGGIAVRDARHVINTAPDRSPGSAGDLRAAAMVAQSFRSVHTGQVLEQRFGSGGQLRNVILKLPGSSTRQVVLIAPRDTASPPGAASSAAATGILEELAANLAAAQHTETLILVSTDGASAGGSGAAALASGFLDPALVDGVVALEQPGSAALRQPFVLDSSVGAQSTAAQLVRTAELSLTTQAGLRSHGPGPFGQLAALALPAGLGEQAVLIDRGFNAVGLSAAGESPLPASLETARNLSPAAVGGFGRAAFDIVVALDAASAPPVHGPAAYLEVGGNLVPGWALATLAIALILPALIAAVDAVARASRRGALPLAARWAVLRPLPFLAALIALWALALFGALPRPPFPFDPRRYGIGLGELLGLALLAGIAGLVWWRLGRNRLGVRLVPQAGAAMLGLIATLSLLVIWLANVYLALLLVPLGHTWVPQARRETRPGRWLAAGTVALAALPLVLGVASIAGPLGLGAALPWQLAIAIGDGGIGVVTALAGATLAGSLAALVVLAGAGAEAGPPGPVPSRARTQVIEAPRVPSGAAGVEQSDAIPLAHAADRRQRDPDLL